MLWPARHGRPAGHHPVLEPLLHGFILCLLRARRPAPVVTDVKAVDRVGELRIPVRSAGSTGRWREHHGAAGDVGVGGGDAVVPLARALGVDTLGLLVLLLLALAAAAASGSCLLVIMRAAGGGVVGGCRVVTGVLAMVAGGVVAVRRMVIARVNDLDA